MKSVLMMEATMDMKTSFLEEMMVMETLLQKDIMQLVTSLLMLNLIGILLMMIMGHSPYYCYEGYHHSYSREVYFESLYGENSIEKEQKEKEVVVLDKSEVVSVFTSQTNSILVRNSSCLQKFSIQNIENEMNLDYHIYKIIRSFTPTSYLSFDHFLKGTKLNSFALIFYRISLEHPCTWTSMLGRNHTMEFEEQEEIVGKELSLCHEDSLISPFLNSSFLYHEVIIGDTCSISFGGDLFLVVPNVYKCLSYHASLEDPLLNSGSMLNPPCHDYGLINNASIDSIVISLKLECALLDILHSKCIGKFVENFDYFSSSLYFYEES
ncbi:hypothetical protein M9H77_31253 [Catharanthus roseus]|uniref:Uncharacterized protein n=1 Tax=Catharanthus roseus TaxID=4058 RepID=A0ACC0A0H8_CATRO|nr:hypothetical protein M9H77_31253 [Catharanthus roseus]